METSAELVEHHAAKLVSLGLVHRLMHLIHKRVLITIFLEENWKKGEECVLEKEVKDLSDLITTYTAELDAFGEVRERVTDGSRKPLLIPSLPKHTWLTRSSFLAHSCARECLAGDRVSLQP